MATDTSIASAASARTGAVAPTRKVPGDARDRQYLAAGGQSLPGAGRARQELESALEVFARALENSPRALSFRIDDDAGRVVVSVSNPDTGEVIRQIPAPHVLEFARFVRAQLAADADAIASDRLRGLLVDERA